jgi:hypothetical protein
VSFRLENDFKLFVQQPLTEYYYYYFFATLIIYMFNDMSKNKAIFYIYYLIKKGYFSFSSRNGAHTRFILLRRMTDEQSCSVSL